MVIELTGPIQLLLHSHNQFFWKRALTVVISCIAGTILESSCQRHINCPQFKCLCHPHLCHILNITSNASYRHSSVCFFNESNRKCSLQMIWLIVIQSHFTWCLEWSTISYTVASIWANKNWLVAWFNWKFIKLHSISVSWFNELHDKFKFENSLKNSVSKQKYSAQFNTLVKVISEIYHLHSNAVNMHWLAGNWNMYRMDCIRYIFHTYQSIGWSWPSPIPVRFH